MRRSLGARIARFATSLSILLTCCVVNADTTPVLVHVRGTSRIEPRAGRSEGKLVLSGVLVDDGVRPLSGEKVGVSLATDDDRAHPLSLSTGGTVAACEGSSGAAAQPTLARSDLLLLSTDDGGRFCVRIGLALGRYFARFVFAGGVRVDGTSADLSGDLSLNPVTLRFDPEPHVVELDATTAPTIDAIAVVDDDRGTSPAPGLALALTNERGARLGIGTTSSSGRARFSLATSLVGPPGEGELRVEFPGNGTSAAATHAAPIERRVRVDLAAPDAHDGMLGGGVPDEGVPIDIVASARTSSEPVVTPTGMVVARVGDTVVGAAPLTDGRARVVVTFGSGAATEASVRFGYTSDAPWFVRGNEAIVTLPVRGPSPWRNVPFLIAGACVLAWLVLGRTRFGGGVKTHGADPSTRSPGRVEARMDVVRAEPGNAGWRGTVVDAHDGRAISDARVSLERPAFDRVTVVITSTTDVAGAFSLSGVEVREGDKLTSEAPLHARLEQRPPASGELAIALVLRRRALLDRLVAWAKRSGAPFDGPVEPTPGHVRRAAGTSFAVARWADAVEKAAFGGAPVDARAELDVERLGPIGANEGADQRGAGETDTIKDPPRDGDPADVVEPRGGGHDE